MLDLALRRGRPLYSGQNGWSQSVLYSEGSTVHKEEDYSGQNGWSQSVRCSTVHKEEDNLSIVDEMAGPNVSFIQRFHCT